MKCTGNKTLAIVKYHTPVSVLFLLISIILFLGHMLACHVVKFHNFPLYLSQKISQFVSLDESWNGKKVILYNNKWIWKHGKKKSNSNNNSNKKTQIVSSFDTITLTFSCVSLFYCHQHRSKNNSNNNNNEQG